MFNATDDPSSAAPSTLLKTLCYIIIGTCGLALLMNVTEAMAPPDAQAAMDMLESNLERFGSSLDQEGAAALDGLREAYRRIVESTAAIALVKALSCALAMVGAWFMLRLRRNGFHLYVVAGLIWCFAPMLLTGGNVLTWGLAFLYGFVCLVFTVLLASRLKELH